MWKFNIWSRHLNFFLIKNVVTIFNGYKKGEYPYLANIPRRWYLPNIGSYQKFIMDIMVFEHVHLPSFWKVNYVLFWNTIHIFLNASHKMVISCFYHHNINEICSSSCHQWKPYHFNLKLETNLFFKNSSNQFWVLSYPMFYFSNIALQSIFLNYTIILM